MAFPLGFALLGLFFRLIFAGESTTCKYNEYTLESEAGKKYFAHKDKSPYERFKPCTRSSIGQKEVLPYNLENVVNEFKPCSAGCNNDREVHVQQCAEEKMPKKLKDSYSNRGGSACGHQRSEEQKSISPVLLVVVVGMVILVTIILSGLYLRRRLCRQITIILDESNFLLTSPDEKVDCEATFEGQSSKSENFKSFDNSGIIVRSTSPESLPHEVQEVGSKICWDEVLPITLLSDEVQLSPVIQFHPYGSKLSNPVCVTIPHSALVDSSHGWSIGLKSAEFSDGAVVWNDKVVDKIDVDNLSFHTDCLLSYVVVGTPVRNSYPTKKRFYCAVLGGQGKVGPNYTVYLYLFDECEASLEKIIQDEKSRKRILLSSLHSLHVESVHETDVKVAIKQLSSRWKLVSKNPQIISHKSLRQSYQTFPCAEIIFVHDNGQNGRFRCTFEVTAGDTTSQICVRTSVMENLSEIYKESGTCHCHQMVTGQGARASKPLASLINDHSDFVENIFQRLDTLIDGAGHFEVIGKYFDFSIYTIRSRFEKSDGGPSRAMIEAIVVRHPEITVESFAEVVEKKARRKDVANLLRAYDLDSLKKSF